MVSDLTLEEDILSSCISWNQDTVNAQLLISSVKDYDFHSTKHQKVFKLFKKALKENAPTDLISLENIGAGTDELIALKDLETHRTFLEIKPFIRRLKWISKARRLSLKTSNLTQTFIESMDDIENVYNETESDIVNIMDERISGDQGHFLPDRLGNYFEKFEKLMSQEQKPGIPIGISKFDDMTGGLRPGENVVVAGRPGMGKSSFALTVVANLILKGFKPAFFSLELSETEIINKLISIISEINDRTNLIEYQWLRTPKPNKRKFSNMAMIASILYDSPFYYNCDPYQDINEIKSIVRGLKYDKKIDIVIIDHIGKLVKDHHKEYAETTNISKECKNMAMENDIVSMPLVQLRRESEKAGAPSLSHLKGTGAIEEDADIVFFPWRPYIIDRNQHKPSEALLIVGKARNAIATDYKMTFSTETTLFEYDNEEGSDEAEF